MKKISLITALLLSIPALVPAFSAEEAATGLKTFSIFYDTQFGLTSRDMGSGPDSKDGTYEFNFRRNRFGFIGQFNKILGFYYQAEYIEDQVVTPLNIDNPGTANHDLYALDAQIRLTFYDWLQFRFGKFKHNLIRENLEGCFTPLTMDRSIFYGTPFKSSRDVGAAVWGNIISGLLQYRADAMEGKKSDGTPAPASNFRYTGRLHLSLFDKETSYGYKGTYLGKKQVLTVGGGYQYESEVVYDNVPEKEGVKDYKGYSFDLFYEQPTPAGTITRSSAYMKLDFNDAYTGPKPDAGVVGISSTKKGYYVKAGYLIPVRLGPGQLQIFGRYDSFQFAKLKLEDLSMNQKVVWLSAGFNYYIYGQALKITGEYSSLDYDKEEYYNINNQDFQTFRLFIQARFQAGINNGKPAVGLEPHDGDKKNIDMTGKPKDSFEGC